MQNCVAQFMATPRRVSALGLFGLMAFVAAAACTSGSVGARGTPTASPASSEASPSQASPRTTSASSPTPAAPPPVTGAYGVLVSLPNAGQYNVALVGIDGKVVASRQVSAPPAVTCGGAAGAPVPLPVSTSNSGVYFEEASGGVTFMVPNGQVRQAHSVPAGTASRRSMFAVSPDDKRIAVIVADYSSSGASTRLYVEDVGGGNRDDIFSETGAKSLWPIGWRGTNNLVVAVVPSCTQGGGPFCCGIQELHVVDPATAIRRFTLGNVTTCPIVGSASPAGVICWDGSQSKVLNWTAGTVRTYAQPGPALQFLSPNGSQVAVVDNTGTSMQGTSVSFAGLFACTWLDETHLLAGGDSQHQPRVADLGSKSQIPVPAQGDCAGRLPGGL